MNKINNNLYNTRSVVSDNDQLTALEMIYALKGSNNGIIEELKNKVEQGGDFKGSWYGIERPEFSEPGIAGAVVRNSDNIELLSADVEILTEEKVDKVEGKGLSTNDLTNELKDKILEPNQNAMFWWINPDSSKNSYGDHSIFRDFNGKYHMFDCGHPWDFQYLKTKMEREGIKELESLWLTHMHNDHNGTAPDIITHFKPKKVYGKTPNWNTLPSIESEPDWATRLHYDLMMGAINSTSTIWVELTSDSIIKISDETGIQVLNTYTTNAEQGYNRCSLSFIIKAKQHNICVSGDVQEEGITAIKNHGVKLDVMSAPHKGNDPVTQQLKDCIYKCLPTNVIGQWLNQKVVAYKVYNVHSKLFLTGTQNSDVKFNISDVVTSDIPPCVTPNIWYDYNGDYFFFNDSGVLIEEGFVYSPYNQRYYFKNWTMQTGWIMVSNIYYYGMESGVLHCGTGKTIDGLFYIFRDDGRLVTSTQYWYNGVLYNCNSSGVATATI